MPPFFVIVCRPLLSSFAVRFCRPSRLLLLSIVNIRRSHLSSFFALCCRCLPLLCSTKCVCWQGSGGVRVRQLVGGFIDKKQRLPSPLPKPRAHGVEYDAMSRRIQLEWAQVRLRRRQTHGGRRPRCGKKFPLFFKPMKKYTYLAISKQTKRPRHRIRCDERAHRVRTGAGMRLRLQQMHGGRRPHFGKKFPLFFNQ